MKIFLIGMPGSGKSTLGKILAEKMALPFIDLDTVITKSQQKSVADIFEEEGQATFRQIEADQLRKSSSEHHSFAMACGGGTPCFHNSLEFMKEQGSVVFLNVSIETLAERVQHATHRPLLQLESGQDIQRRLNQLKKQRLPFYCQAHIIVSEMEISAEVIMDRLLKK
jgi:shikimate kinase